MVAAGIVALLGAVLWADPAWHTQRYATAAGERQHLTLPDGSDLTLNTRTVAEVEWHLRSRQVRLVDGEALFDVTHSTWRPFVVRAGETTVRVVGTAFNVRRADPHVTVTVLRGGALAGTVPVAETRRGLIQLMAGRDIQEFFARGEAAAAGPDAENELTGASNPRASAY